MWHVYGLVDSVGQVHYVGCTGRPLNMRLADHRRRARLLGDGPYNGNRALAAWMPGCAGIWDYGEYATRGEAEQAESRIIHRARLIGHDLLNERLGMQRFVFPR